MVKYIDKSKCYMLLLPIEFLMHEVECFRRFFMRFSKKVSCFLATLMAIAMCFSLSISAFAAEIPSTEEVSATYSDAQVYSSGQVTVNHKDNPVRGTATYRICPAKGAVLKLQINNNVNLDTSAVTVKVTKNGGWWPSKTITVPRGQGTTMYTLIENCNGEVYTVEFVADPGYFVGILYANAYA